MIMTPAVFLLLNLALAFYNVGTIWAHEVDIFRSWKLVDPATFHRMQRAHWRKLPFWVFAPVGLALAGAIGLIWYHPAGSPMWAAWSALGCQAASHVLTVLLWGRWQANLSADPLGSASPHLTRILSTHWVRTLQMSAYAAILFVWAVEAMACSRHTPCVVGPDSKQATSMPRRKSRRVGKTHRSIRAASTRPRRCRSGRVRAAPRRGLKASMGPRRCRRGAESSSLLPLDEFGAGRGGSPLASINHSRPLPLFRPYGSQPRGKIGRLSRHR
jgi:hypothetical protein